ncbi:MAG: ribonuclease III [Pseudobutyrivibrio sp.]|nr:ribonuclease III [Pseudobutyrivibrio sp.]
MDESINVDLFTAVSRLMDINEIELVNYSPLTLAYVGDAVYEMVVRTVVVCEANMSVNKLHKSSTKLVKAKAQADIIHALSEELTENEMKVYKRGRNAKSYSKAKNATYSDYRNATGFEALIGYLYFAKQTDRMMYIIRKGIELIESNDDNQLK